MNLVPIDYKAVDAIMSQAQVFASGWSLVGGPFDQGDQLESAEAEKAMLRAMVIKALGAVNAPALAPTCACSTFGRHYCGVHSK